MAVFKDCSVVLDLKKVPYKERKRLTSAILDNGGNLLYVVNQKCSFVVTSSWEDLSINKQRSAQKHQIPVVGLQFVWSCLEKGLLLPVKEHTLKPPPSDLTPQPLPHPGIKLKDQTPLKNIDINTEKTDTQGKIRIFKNDHDIPEFPSHFQVAKYSVFYKTTPRTWSVLEIQSGKGETGQQYRVVKSVMQDTWETVVIDKQAHGSRSEETVGEYLAWMDELFASGFSQTQKLLPDAWKLASPALQQLVLEEKLNSSTVSQEVGTFVELIWKEALGSLSSILAVPVTSISLNDVSRVEGLLLQVQKCQCEEEEKALLDEVNTLLPLRMTEPDSKQKHVSQKLDLCQLIRDILNINEVTLGNPSPSSLGKYRALRCSIEQVRSESPEFQSVCQLLQDRPVQIHQILHVSRGAELHLFREELGNIRPLLHSSRPSSFVGILSRGLLLPRIGVEQHGIERTDVGNLGGGIYFSDSLSTSVKYSKSSETDGSRLLLVCEVALGQCKDLHRRDITLSHAPEGYNSVHGVRQTQKTRSDFEDDEYVVYNTDQVRLKYVVQYSLMEEQVKNFQPNLDMSVEQIQPVTTSELLSNDDSEGLEEIKNPLEEVTAGLLDSSGQTLPLQAVHVRCKLMDLLAQVVIFQTYTNQSTVPIEAKYVFPLDETAAVCGFEAFINGKHVIGKVKEKEQARKEYRQAIEKGHGAYLMDQDAPDVFTISVGNLPPGATVLIKVTFITELVVRAGSIIFSLPGSVAPWQQSAALNQRTQTSVEKVRVNELRPTGEFSLCMSIEMPYEINHLECSHQISRKRTDCKAVVSTLPDQTLNTDGFQLSFTLSKIHMPRMWVEKHPEKESEACMLVFYPDFESSGVSGVSDVLILLDTSESMRGEAMLNARRIALKVLHSLDPSLQVNIICFGTDYKEAFNSPRSLQETEVFQSAKKFVMFSPAVGGSTELWRPLRSLNLLPPSHGVRNILLISDGHVQNQPQTLQLVQENARHTRLFTCGLSPTANRHMLRALAQAGGGAYEFFDTKTKHTWTTKVKSQVKCMESPGCSSVSVKWQQFNPTAPPPVQAPSQLHALFSDHHTLVYGFVPHCTQATLFGDLSGQEIKTMISTTELQKTKGTFLHKLTARAIIRDYEDGSLGTSEAEHEGKKAELKSYIIELSKEFSILSQFTSFVAIEERDQEQPDSGITDVPKLIADEDVDILPYMGWTEEEEQEMAVFEEQEGEGEMAIFGGKEGCSLIPGVHPQISFGMQSAEDEFEMEMYDDITIDSAVCKSLATMGHPQNTLEMQSCLLDFAAEVEHVDKLFDGDDVMDSDSWSSHTEDLPEIGHTGLMSRSLLKDSPSSHKLKMLCAPALSKLGAVTKVVSHRERCIVPEHKRVSNMASHSPQPHVFQPFSLTVDSDTAGSTGPTASQPVHPPAFSSNHARFSAFPDGASCYFPVIGSSSRTADSAVVPPETPAKSAPPPPSGFMGSPYPFVTADSAVLPAVSQPVHPPVFGSVSIVPSSFDFGTKSASDLPGFGLARHVSSFSRADSAVAPPEPLAKSFLESAPAPPPPPISFMGSPSPFVTADSAVLPAASQPVHPPVSQPVHPPVFGSVSSVPSSFVFGTKSGSAVARPAPQTTRPLFFGSAQTLSCFFESAPPPPPIGFLRCLSSDIANSAAPPPTPPPDDSFHIGSLQSSSPYITTGFVPSALENKQPSLSRSHSPVQTASLNFSKSVTAEVVPLRRKTVFRIQQQAHVASPTVLPDHEPVTAQLQCIGPRGPQVAAGHSVGFAYGSGFSSTVDSLQDAHRVMRRSSFFVDHLLQRDSVRVPYEQPDKINWEELLDLQRQEGYWECTGGLSSFLDLDVDFFANVFLKEKGICSLGVKAHADILRLVATLLVLQLMRVMKMVEVELFQSLFRLTDSPEPRPECYDAVKRAVDWVCWADKQYPCVYSRLEFGFDWESCTRQLLGLDSLPPCSALTTVLQRRPPVPVV